MANAWICDRCRRFMNCPPSTTIKYKKLPWLESELCATCSWEFKRFMHGAKLRYSMEEDESLKGEQDV